MKNNYFVTGAWGVKFNNSTILYHWANLLVSNFDGVPENESKSIHTAIAKLKAESYRQLESELLKNGFDKRSCAWQYLNLCPLKN